MGDAPDIQIIGTRKSSATRKAVRFFSERGLKAHFVDLNERGLRPRELENIAYSMNAMELIDSDSATYRRGGYDYLEFDPIEELLEKPLLMKMPVVRRGKRVVVGEDMKGWESLLNG